jgi:hypothetical protein
MIAYDLQCANGHTFEGWFEDSASLEHQQRDGLVACPVCADTGVSRIFSSFAIKSAGPTDSDPNQPMHPEEIVRMARKVSEYVEKNFDDVGANFAKTALKIHYGVEEPRNIRGVSTREEEKTLREEGVEFYKLPVPDHDSEPEPKV